jgi:hypothetical protein
VNKLPPVGLMLFSLGAGGGVLDGGVVVVVTVVEVAGGAWLPLVAHPAAVAISAAPPTTMRMGRPKRLGLMDDLLSGLAARR